MYKLLRLLTTLFFVSAMPTTLLCMDLNVFYVGQGSFSMLRSLNSETKSALIYDCGYDGGSSWIYNTKMSNAKKEALVHMLNGIDDVFIVISHDDSDHNNLFNSLITDVLPDKNIHLFARDNYWTKFELKNQEKKERNFYDAKDKSREFTELIAGKFNLDFSFDFKIPECKSKDKNDMSIVLKVACNNQAILFTGDASKNTLNALTAAQDNILNDDFWKGIKVFIAPHHGSNSNEELEWAEKVIEKSEQKPVVTIISSNPQFQDHFPDLDTVAKLYKYYNNENICLTNTHEVPCFFTFAKVDLRRFTTNKKDELKHFVSGNDMSEVPKIYNYKVTLNAPIFVTSSLLGTNALSACYHVVINQQTVKINDKDISTKQDRGVFTPSIIQQGIKYGDAYLEGACNAIMNHNEQLVGDIRKTLQPAQTNERIEQEHDQPLPQAEP